MNKHQWVLNTDPPPITFDLPDVSDEVGVIHDKIGMLPFVTGVTRVGDKTWVTFASEPSPQIRGEIMRRIKKP